MAIHLQMVGYQLGDEPNQSKLWAIVHILGPAKTLFHLEACKDFC